MPKEATLILPHGDLLDYCSFAFLVRADADMQLALARLENVTQAEAATKHKALQEVRDWFVWRSPGDGGPSAADRVFESACAMVRQYANRSTAAPASLPNPGSVDAGAAGTLHVGGKCLLA